MSTQFLEKSQQKRQGKRMRKISFGIDTSNYKTSVAMIDQHGEILCNLQRYLTVKEGERGLRQSTALFQHVGNLPELLEAAFSELQNIRNTEAAEIACVSVSEKPRPVEGSYMPCFQAGVSTARSLAAALGVPCHKFSHQEGHIEAACCSATMEPKDRFISFHFSGGTTEALLVDHGQMRIVGGTKDIAFGQVLDRIGVSLGMEFPCGAQLDALAAQYPQHSKGNILPKIKCLDGFINLSGIETSCQRVIGQQETVVLVSMLFQRLADAICQMCIVLAETYHVDTFLFAGGVSASKVIGAALKNQLKTLHLYFGAPVLCTDNAVGIALLGGKKQWH